ncbi:MAG: molybdopterin oxidoreductase family protein, partial [Gemmatimonadaceae bacterium]
EIWNELRVATKGGIADYSGITYEKIDAQDGVFWPCPSDDSEGTPRLFTERFAHADGRARMIPVTYRPPAETPGGSFPFFLTTGRVVYQYLSGNQTRRLAFLNSQAPEPWVEIHPIAAGRLDIASEDVVRVRTPRGAMELRALVTPTIRPDTLFIPFHYGHRHAVNQLTNAAVDPTVRIPEFKCCAAMIEKLGAPSAAPPTGATENLTAGNAPGMFPYQVAPAAARLAEEGAH